MASEPNMDAAMRPAEFTSEQIIEAGKALQADGRNVTGFALRQRVGGGNPNRLKQLWEEHLASQSVVTAEPIAELPIEVAEQLRTLSDALLEKLGAMAVELNDRAVKASERRVAEVVRTAGEQREQAERELADASQTVDDLEQQLDASAERGEALQQRLDAAQLAGQAQAVELAQLRERLVAVEQAGKQDAEKSAAREVELQAQLADARRAEQAAREREGQATGALAAAERRHIEDAEVTQRVRGELRTTADALASAEARLGAVSEQLRDSKAAEKSARTEAKVAEKSASEAAGREQALLAQIKQAKLPKAPVKRPSAE